VLIAWLVVGVLMYSFAHNLSDVTNNSASANIPASAPSTRVLLLQEAAQRGQADSDQVTVVFARPGAARRRVRGAHGPAHRQQPRGHRPRPSRQRHRRATARRALPTRRHRPAGRPRPPREAAAAAARATPDVATVSPAAPAGGYTGYSVTLSVPPYGASGHAAIGILRDRLHRAAPGSLVGGDPAIQYDITQAARHDALVLIPLVLAVILLVIGVLLDTLLVRTVLVPASLLAVGERVWWPARPAKPKTATDRVEKVS
jgi:hypothetical protein